MVRSFVAHRTAGYYLILMMFLSLLTGMGWYASFIMPDILGPVLYLSIYLLVCAPETLSRGERIALYPMGVWAITGHATHLPLAVALCALLALISACQGRDFLRRARGLAEVAAMIALAAAAQIALHGYLYGKPTLNGERPPYLMVRIIADGPGRWYLEKHCASEQWVACKRAAGLSDDANSLLWDADGFYDGATDEEADRLAEEETPFVLAAVRSYPREQFLRSAANFGEQLTTFGLFGFHPNDWTLEQFNEAMPAARASYLRSRQARNALPLRLLSTIQLYAVLVSLAAMAVLIPLLWRRHSPRLAGLSLVIVSVIVLNALLTGVLSGPDDRYQGRVIWLVPLLAGIYLMDWLVQRKASEETTQAGSSAGTGRGVRASAAAMKTMGKNSSV